MKPNSPNVFIVTPENISQAISLQTGADVQQRLKEAKAELKALDNSIETLMQSGQGSFQVYAQLGEKQYQYAFLCGEIRGLNRALGIK